MCEVVSENVQVKRETNENLSTIIYEDTVLHEKLTQELDASKRRRTDFSRLANVSA